MSLPHLKILHTSDWHLGRSLYGRKRYVEFTAFLDWLAQTIEDEKIDVLLVAGDVFDTSTPSNRAQELYYRFLCRVSTSCCRHVVIIGGNHDSPSFLNAPKALLHALNVHVVGAMTEQLIDELIVLRDAQDSPQAIVCAVPYLRDKDIRTVEAGESLDDKNAKLIHGLKNHYAEVCALAEQQRADFEAAGYPGVPIIGMGHLFTAGGKTLDGDGVRDLYVGSLAHVGADAFPASIDYLALGHLHVPQRVGSAEHIRYSGSPIAMGYGEAGQQKKVLIIAFDGGHLAIKERSVPCFQALQRISGSLDEIRKKLLELKQAGSDAWLEIEYTGVRVAATLNEMIEEILPGSGLEVLSVKNRSVMERVAKSIASNETLDDLSVTDVFERCLDSYAVADDERVELTASYQEIVKTLQEEDRNAE